MSKSDEYKVALAALDHARALGLDGDVERDLRRMAHYSAPVTHVLGNRRFDNFVLLVRHKVVLAVNWL
jgi:hypothetical protein